jgi:hypothetical protein
MEKNQGKDEIGAMHSHLPESGDFSTATDICTLMLYAQITKWKQHIVVSKKIYFHLELRNQLINDYSFRQLKCGFPLIKK